MLNTTVTIDCDECGRCFEKFIIAPEPDQHSDAICLLQSLVHEAGWHVYRNHYRCCDCYVDELSTSPVG